jgi:hypothetical protein
MCGHFLAAVNVGISVQQNLHALLRLKNLRGESDVGGLAPPVFVAAADACRWVNEPEVGNCPSLSAV